MTSGSSVQPAEGQEEMGIWIPLPQELKPANNQDELRRAQTSPDEGQMRTQLANTLPNFRIPASRTGGE